MNQTIANPSVKIALNTPFLSEIINKISNIVSIIQESSAEAKEQYKKHSILGGGWE
jgi:hypothetical protein